MRNPVISNKFKRDYKLCLKNNIMNKNISELQMIMSELQKGKILPQKYKDHDLHGEYKNCRGCHITPDWVLIYRVEESANKIHFVRIGSHANLYE
jgi:mRNA interferase YafQ